MFCAMQTFQLLAQGSGWQQRVQYKMDVKLNVQTNRFAGTQQLEYWNNSPDTLKKDRKSVV